MSGSGFAQFIPLILIFVVFYFFLIRPQQKKMKQHKEMINGLTRGDKIVTSGGLIGEIIKVDENKELTVKIAEDVSVRLAAGMVSELINKPNQNKK